MQSHSWTWTLWVLELVLFCKDGWMLDVWDACPSRPIQPTSTHQKTHFAQVILSVMHFIYHIKVQSNPFSAKAFETKQCSGWHSELPGCVDVACTGCSSLTAHTSYIQHPTKQESEIKSILQNDNKQSTKIPPRTPPSKDISQNQLQCQIKR